MNAQLHSFDPATQDPREFRAALGRFGTGVTIVTCDSDAGPMGITANSFASVSLDPPLVLWSPAKASKRYPHFIAAKHFAIHVLGEENRDICAGFSRSGAAFDALDWQACDRGVPLIENCLSRFECTQEAVHDAGDHSIIVARVKRVTTREGDPLLFFSGRYGGFAGTS
ncbi:unnamed protein product [Cyprideis torosa]|uniref:Uncharacterized protein n=1 Tax=Cyprideis torosa TaxID=163714 RepID=A0A7R8WVY7_9CRUS|nr:unnamed protein product [Cyprideis torosa]CAG0911441.1 unnamed protein product [Cyprideis torosa]